MAALGKPRGMSPELSYTCHRASARPYTLVRLWWLGVGFAAGGLGGGLLADISTSLYGSGVIFCQRTARSARATPRPAR